MAARKSKPEHDLPYNGGNGRIDKCIRFMKQGKIKTGGTLLDVGGSIGDLGYASRDLFSKRIIVDISSQQLKSAEKKGCDTLQTDVDKCGFLGIVDNEIDVVTALDFIEHIIDPEFFAQESFRVLKTGGEIFINTPNIEYFEHFNSLVINGMFPHTSGDKEVYHGGHLAFYGKYDLDVIFGKAGFVGMEQIRDEEGFRQPQEFWLNLRKPRSQSEYVQTCERLGNPNLLFKAVKP